ncbi:LysM peptidoglycan-binding domain-containing protein [Leucothrix pacifica]|uniref:LysM domain-containing protein n=1 Tax=Leucothrix pacifica TaxID=1247513 RepID=A0A317C041_9GAMM|nr:hypothetical protein [Leucothrix pacifica]PWQ92026.1 hypothetical protein DKW60_23295 [Leucothrix pacifica]
MKRLLPWLLLSWLALAQADDTDTSTTKSLLEQVSEEAAQTSILNTDTNKASESLPTNTATTQDSAADMDKLTQSVALRLSELLGTQNKTDADKLTLSLETVVSDALHDGKQMDQIRDAVAQAMSEITGQTAIPENDNPAGNDTANTQQASQSTATDLPVPKLVDSDLENAGGSTASAQEASTGSQDTATSTTPAATTVTVLAGESLFRVAQRVYGEENGRRFLDLFAANRDIIKDINVVHEGQVLKLPEAIADQAAQ